MVSKVSERFCVPMLLLFLALGMLAGSEGLGGIYFDDPELTQWISTVALAIILFSGGMDTNWQSIQPVIKAGFSLATLGVVITAGLMGVFVHLLLNLEWSVSFLIGAIASSTDAAAVFSVLRFHFDRHS